jgi:MscS family membrane protein
MTLLPMFLLAEGSLWDRTINYTLIVGNPIWRFILILVVLLVTFAAGRVLQYITNAYAEGLTKRRGENAISLIIKCLNKPMSVVIFALGLYLAKLCLVFDNPQTEAIEGLKDAFGHVWTQVSKAVAALAVAYAIFSLVDVIEYYLLRWTNKTQTKLDNMLVPVIRKSLRITIAIIAAMFIIENILHQDVKSILLGAGVGGIAIAMAAKETVANFFGSITIFADKPFQIDDMIKSCRFYRPCRGSRF